MDFGVVAPAYWNPKQILEAGISAENIGLDFFLITDHYLLPNTNASVDSWTILSALAAKTERIRLGTCVTPIPFRPPPLLAKIIATVDQISNGRVIVGVGAGWHRPEFAAYSTWDSAGVRVNKTLEGIQLMTRLWTTNDPFDFKGKYYAVEGAILEPKPVQKPYPPLWFGTTGTRMLKITSEYADAWVPGVPGISMEIYQQVISTLRRHAAESGKKSVKVKFNGKVEEIANSIRTFVDMGCDGAILVRTPFNDLVAAMKRLNGEIAPSYR